MWSVFYLFVKNLILFLWTINLFAAPEHSMILSFPRSGSTFFHKALSKSNQAFYLQQPSPIKWEKGLSSMRVANEYFNFLGQALGEKNKHLFVDFPDSDLEKAYAAWRESGFNVTKEIHAYTKIPFFIQKFNCCVLFRHRKYTFPSSAPLIILPIYQSFMHANHKKKELKDIQKYLLENTKTDNEKQCAAHMIAWYIQLKNCGDNKISIIRFEKLMRLNEKELKKYLLEKLPKQLYSESLVSYIYNNRLNTVQSIRHSLKRSEYILKWCLWGKDFWDYKENQYKKLNVEPYCQKLIAYMKEQDPHFKYWDLLI